MFSEEQMKDFMNRSGTLSEASLKDHIASMAPKERNMFEMKFKIFNMHKEEDVKEYQEILTESCNTTPVPGMNFKKGTVIYSEDVIKDKVSFIFFSYPVYKIALKWAKWETVSHKPQKHMPEKISHSNLREASNG